MGKSLKITESQLKRLMKTTINEVQHKSEPTKSGLKMINIVNEQLDPTQQLGKWVMKGGEWVWKNILNPDVGNAKKTPTQQTPPPTQQTPPPTQQTPPPPKTVQDEKSVTLQIQNKLIALKYLYTKPTGFYGPKTKEAVKDWQLTNQGKGLKADGYFIKGRDDKALGVDMGNIPRLFYQPPVAQPKPKPKTVVPPAPQRDTTKISSIPSRPTGNVSQRQPAPDTISTDYRNRQGNY